MVVEILMSTMKRKTIKSLDLKNRNIDNNCLIINQTDNEEIILENNIKMINSKTKGLAVSRNIALGNCSGDYLIIADDDVKYVENYQEIIKKAFSELPDADVLTFQILKDEHHYYKDYKNKIFKHNKVTIRKVSSIEIVLRNKIKDSNVKFNPHFGLGAKYTSGEENIFMLDLINKGYNIYYYPTPIVYHPDITSARTLTDSVAYSKGALFYKMYGKLFFFVCSLYILKKFKSIYNYGIFRFIKQLYKGYKSYKEIERDC